LKGRTPVIRRRANAELILQILMQDADDLFKHQAVIASATARSGIRCVSRKATLGQAASIITTRRVPFQFGKKLRVAGKLTPAFQLNHACAPAL